MEGSKSKALSKAYSLLNKKVGKLARKKGINIDNFDIVIKYGMEVVEIVDPRLSGEEKQALFIELIETFLTDLKDSGRIEDDVAETIIGMVNAFGPGILRLVVTATKGGLDINKIKKCWCF